MPRQEVVLEASELACRIAEAVTQMKRPEGATAVQAVLMMEPADQEIVRRAATAALDYVRECMHAGGVAAWDGSKSGPLQ